MVQAGFWGETNDFKQNFQCHCHDAVLSFVKVVVWSFEEVGCLLEVEGSFVVVDIFN